MHRSRLGGLIIDCRTDDLEGAARFWSAALGLPARKSADPAEAAWWFGLMRNGRLRRTRRALRILLEAVK